ncbi:hypothetical protein EOA25_04415 [Mesorhizobium sp. M2A.F.Ca.ET.040.01.1.1]|nr:hypothetical protein EOA25_04415 [Mesorhizobium sp. M2A.F.Ca.ET.040.01.1.1]
MLAVERTTRLFIKSLQEALPAVRLQVSRSHNIAGRSNYVFIFMPHRSFKVRISDHAIGMRRALRGEEDLYIVAGRLPSSWAVWLGDLAAIYRSQQERAATLGRSTGPENRPVAL